MAYLEDISPLVGDLDVPLKIRDQDSDNFSLEAKLLEVAGSLWFFLVRILYVVHVAGGLWF